MPVVQAATTSVVGRRLSEEDATRKAVRKIVDSLVEGDDSAALCSHRPVFGDVFDALGAAIFQSGGNPALPLPVAVIAIAGLAAASIFILDRRVRPVDIVT